MESLGAVGSIASVIGLGLSVWLLVAGKRISDRLLEQRRAIKEGLYLAGDVKKLLELVALLEEDDHTTSERILAEMKGIVKQAKTYIGTEALPFLLDIEDSLNKISLRYPDVTSCYSALIALQKHSEQKL